MKKLKIAITGGIGSGKSTACKIIQELKYPVFSADEIYNEVLKNFFVKLKIRQEFGDVFLYDGSLDRKTLSQIVFADKEKLLKLNAITHPAIIKKMNKLLKATKSRIVFVEVPLLFESGLENKFDKVIIIKRDLSLRIQSVVKRDNLTIEQIEKRIKNQYIYENIDKNTHTVIYNDGDIASLKEKIITVLNEIKNC